MKKDLFGHLQGKNNDDDVPDDGDTAPLNGKSLRELKLGNQMGYTTPI